MRMILLRHGETGRNAENRFQGQSDIPLNEAGVRQAERVARSLDPARWTAVYSSTLDRAVRTAEPIAENLRVPHFRFEALRERDLGELDGLDRAAYARRYPARMRRLLTDPFYAPEGGETGAAARSRFSQGLRRIAEVTRDDPARPVLVVTHGGVLHLLARWILGEHDTRRDMIGNCRAAALDVEWSADGALRADLLRWNVEAYECEGPAPAQGSPRIALPLMPAIPIPRGAA
ncbi:histidine phosphatase family protein [Streptomyces sp. NBC_00442]|uniref:histidine phosphatase family protein n=1 Tax=Streptomyces sp. NBC_00442 TaxID=2903651 RepID=UPI002E229A13